ncbi:MAG: peptidoglycan DD-metalloendopeptidase family protein [Pseudomonadota bacterium]
MLRPIEIHRYLVCTQLLLALLVSACSPPPRVAVVERQTVDQRIETEKIGGSHIRIVEPGDTLHGIAFANGLNVNELAAWNQLGDTSRLQIGQRVRLTRPINFVDNAEQKPIGAKAEPTKISKTRIATSKPVARKQATPPKTSTKSQATPPAAEKAKLRWQWPANGKVISSFARNVGRQGIDIQGKAGEAVLAAGAGEVVYVGNGLKGYGNLVIIKHDEEFLSAYAHNQETFVQEGQRVAARVRIASIGRNKQQREALHFQIRKNGQPVNPLSYLPAR